MKRKKRRKNTQECVAKRENEEEKRGQVASEVEEKDTGTLERKIKEYTEKEKKRQPLGQKVIKNKNKYTNEENLGDSFCYNKGHYLTNLPKLFSRCDNSLP